MESRADSLREREKERRKERHREKYVQASGKFGIYVPFFH
jgi:hypothetical protein